MATRSAADEATLSFLALPSGKRRAIERAVEVNELTQEEIARELGCSRGVVRAAALFARAAPRKRQPVKP